MIVTTPNPMLARLVADLTGDGHIQIQNWKHIISFYSKNMEEIEAFRIRFREMFGIDGKIYVDRRGSVRYKLFFISKEAALILKELETPVGNKTNIPFKVPEWVFRGGDEIKAAYIQGIYDCEGYIYSNMNNGKIRWRIGLSMCKNQNIVDDGVAYMNQLRLILSDFGVKSSPVRKRLANIRKDGSKTIELIYEIEASSFNNFYKYIGFTNKMKREKLLTALAICGDI